MAGLITALVIAQGGYHPISQTTALWNDEAQLIYLSNLARVENGIPPFRFNAELNNAARWFAWDSVVNRPVGFCDHQDSFGAYADVRALAFGFLGGSGAEVAFCGYVTPDAAVVGWLNSYYHRENLLDPNSREAGPGYYLRASDARGYVVLDFGRDSLYAPVVIDNEAPSTSSQQVSLYIYDRETGGGINTYGPATEMQVSNNACFRGAQWQPYTPNLAWSLNGGPPGWRAVYVRTRDSLGRVLSASDWIYLGDDYSPGMLSGDQLSTTSEVAPLVNLDSGGLPLMQFSQNWLLDDSNATYQVLAGSGQRVDDPQAWGGTSFRFDSPYSSAWMWSTDFPTGKPMVAYARVKVADNQSPGEVASFSVNSGNSLSLKGTDFQTAGEYQEFALPFTLPQDEQFLIFHFSRSSTTAVSFDAVTFFTNPIPFQTEYPYMVAGGNYRGQGIWVRYTNGENHFSVFQLAETQKPGITVAPEVVQLHVARDHSLPEETVLNVIQTCISDWRVESNAAWLDAIKDGDKVRLHFHPELVSDGYWSAQVRLIPDNFGEIIIPVSVQVSDHVFSRFFPMSR